MCKFIEMKNLFQNFYLPFTFTRSNSVKSGGYRKLIKTAQWYTTSTFSNAFAIVSGSQTSPINEIIGIFSAWSVKKQRVKIKYDIS